MQLVQKEQFGTIFPVFPRKLAAKFLGVAAPNITNDCKLLRIEKHPTGMTPEEVHYLWAYRVMFVHLYPGSTRSQVAKKIKQQPKTSLKELEKSGYNFEMFCQPLQIFIESGYETITPLQLNRPERKALTEYRAKREREKIKTNRLYLSRKEAARLLGCSVGSVVKMLKALGVIERSLITERVFFNLVELRAKTILWRENYQKQSKTSIKIKRRFAKRGTTLNTKFIYRVKYDKIINPWRYSSTDENKELDSKLKKWGVSKMAKATFNSVVSDRGQIEPIDFSLVCEN